MSARLQRLSCLLQARKRLLRLAPGNVAVGQVRVRLRSEPGLSGLVGLLDTALEQFGCLGVFAQRVEVPALPVQRLACPADVAQGLAIQQRAVEHFPLLRVRFPDRHAAPLETEPDAPACEILALFHSFQVRDRTPVLSRGLFQRMGFDGFVARKLCVARSLVERSCGAVVVSETLVLHRKPVFIAGLLDQNSDAAVQLTPDLFQERFVGHLLDHRVAEHVVVQTLASAQQPHRHQLRQAGWKALWVLGQFLEIMSGHRGAHDGSE